MAKVTVEFNTSLDEAEFHKKLVDIDSAGGFDTLRATFRADQSLRKREALSKFVDEMEMKLRKNDHKTDWKTLPIEGLIRRMLVEIEEFKVADDFEPVAQARRELVDVANFAMIAHDRLGELEQNVNRHAQTPAVPHK